MTGVGRLTRFALRRNRLLIGVWTGVLAVICFASAEATGRLYVDSTERLQAAESINASSALVALYGPILDVHSAGELAMTKTTVTYAAFVMVLTVVLVRRQTRVEEESGRAELVGALALDLRAPLVSAVLLGAVTSLLVALAAAVADVAGGLPAEGSLWFGGSWLGLGLVGTGFGALTAQLSASARACGAAAAALVGASFVVRAVGDTTVSWLGWLSPLGWSTRLRAWSGPRGWVLVLYVALAGVLVTAAWLLRSHRDLGSGLLAERPGPAVGSPRLADAVALNLRIHAPGLAGWTVACLALGAVTAAIVPSVGGFLGSPGSRELIRRLGGPGALQATVVAALVAVVGVVISCFAASVVAHGGADEHDGRTEEVLATAASRTTTFAAVGLVAVGGATWLLLATGAAMAVGMRGATVSAGAALAAALAQAPAVWLVAALAMLGLAVGSRWSFAGWVVVAAFFLVGPLAELLRLPGWVAGLSPYSHVPKIPAEPFAAVPEVTLTLLAVAVTAAAYLRYRGRDIG